MSTYSGDQNDSIAAAQRFEDERKRIQQSCFSKVDEEGHLLESYITHCRISEDALYPSHPPPPNSATDHKKPRVILISVRRSGRVRMHKARENGNGTFSIGKMWFLEDLTEIQNHVGHNDRGFTVTILKPYYWETDRPKDKQLFITSLIKVYHKYTGGEIPKLVGFEGTPIEGVVNSLATAVTATNHLQQPNPHVRTRQALLAASETGGIRSPASTNDLVSSSSNGSSSRRLNGAVSQDNIRREPPPPRLNPGAASSTRTLNSTTNTTSNTSLRSTNSDERSHLRKTSTGSDLSRGAIHPNLMKDPIPARSPARQASSGSNRSGPPPGRASPLPQMPSALDRPPTSRPMTPSAKEATPRSSDASKPASQLEPIKLPDALRPGTSGSGSVNSPNTPFSAKQAQPIALTPLSTSSPKPATPYSPAANAVPIPTPAIPTTPASSTASPTTPTTPKKKKDIAATLRLAATAYSVGRNKPKTPTTPGLGGDKTVDDKVGKGGKTYKIGSPMPIQISNPMPIQSPGITVEPPPRSEARSILGQDQQEENNDAGSGSPVSQLLEPSSAVSAKPTPRSARFKDEFEPQPSPLSNTFSEPPSPRAPSPPPAPKSFLDNFDTSTLDIDIAAALKEFNWDGGGRVEVLEDKIKTALEDVESKNVIVSTDEGENFRKVKELEHHLDEAIRECEQLDGLLTLYAVELTSLHEDIAYIENQGQGLQVQTANQKALQRELKGLLTTITVPQSVLDVLKQSSLIVDKPDPAEHARALQSLENPLMALYKALTTIDPSIVQAESANSKDLVSDENFGNMRALQDKKIGYLQECRTFLGRLKQFLEIKLKAEALDAAKFSDATLDAQGRPKLTSLDGFYFKMYKFTSLILFARDMDKNDYYEIQRLYQAPIREYYQGKFRDHIGQWKGLARRATAEDSEITFAAEEKEEKSVTSTVRTLTVKRSQTLAKSLRSPGDGHEKRSKDRAQQGKIYWNEAYAGALSQMFPIILREQNFVTELFHLSSNGPADFAEFVTQFEPGKRNLGDLTGKRLPDPDKTKVRQLFDIMTGIFEFWIQDLQSLVDWAIKADPLQSVGILRAFEERLSELEDTNQEFLIRALEKLHTRLKGLFSRFVDEQIRAIEDTKVKLKKRKGVILFIRVFPIFTARIEDQLTGVGGELPIRSVVNESYRRINKAMFESLNAIAKEQPMTITAAATQSSNLSNLDPEDKELLNAHIFIIENTFHFIDAFSEMDTPNPVLADFIKRGKALYDEHMSLYVSSVIRRPLGKILDFLEPLEATADKESFILRAPHSRVAFRKLVNHYDTKEIKKGIETLRKRVEKHFAESDEDIISERLLLELVKKLGEAYIDASERLSAAGRDVYGENGKAGGVEWGREEIWAAFRKN